MSLRRWHGFAVASGQQDRQLREAPAQLFGQLHSAHAGHDDVREHQIEGFAGAQQIKRSATAMNEPYSVTAILQQLSGEVGDGDVVIDHEYAAGPVRTNLERRDFRVRNLSHRLSRRKIETKGCSLAHHTLQIDAAAGLMNKAVHLAEPQAGPRA